MLTVGIDYNGANQAGYVGVIIYRLIDWHLHIEHRFFTGDPLADWQNMLGYMEEQNITSWMYSSSVDHFTMDVDGFDWGKDPNSGADCLISARRLK